jgi:DNA invertase Pin-like site-specific DNA recombinase
MQIDALKQAGCERLYIEKASGAHRDRPELKAALEYMRPGDPLAVWRLSLLARFLKQSSKPPTKSCKKAQGAATQYRQRTPEGRLFFNITAAFDEFQRELIVESTKAGLAAARTRGRRGGRPRVLDPSLTPVFGICCPISHLWAVRKSLALQMRGSGGFLLSTRR